MTERVRVQRNEEFEPPARASLDDGVWRMRAPTSPLGGMPSPRIDRGSHVPMPDLPVPSAGDVGLGHELGRIRVYEAGLVEVGRAGAAHSSSQTFSTTAPRIQRQTAAPTPAKGAAKGSTHFEAVVHKSYTVEATTLDEAATQIQQRAEAGSTEWNPKVKFAVDENGVVTSATVDVSIRVTMPNWPGAAKLNKAARAEWNRFVAALKKHEDGHVALVREELKGLGESLVGQDQDAANAAFQAALDDLQSASDAYDDGNDHGRNEGTTIDPDAGSPTTP